MTRTMHHVGSLPPELAPTDTAAMTWFLDRSRDHGVTALPGTQPAGWVVPWLDALRDNPVFRVVDEGDYDAGYDRFRAYAVRWNRRLRPRDVAFDTVEHVRAQMQALLDLRDQRADANRPLMVSVPHPIDLAFFVFGGRSVGRRRPKPVDVWRIMRHLPVFSRAVVDFVSGVLAEFAPEDVVFQLEMPTALVMMHKAEGAFGRRKDASTAASLHAMHTAGLLDRFPVDARVILHLCYGDWQHEPAYRPDSLDFPVDYLNRLAWLLRRRGVMPLPEVHIPVVWGRDRPTLTEDFYRPLTTLDRAWLRVIAGVCTDVDELHSVAALHLMEAAMGRPTYAVAPACGHGRRSVDDTEKCVAVQRTVASATPFTHTTVWAPTETTAD